MDKAEQPTVAQALKPCPFCGQNAEVVCRHKSPAGEAWAIVHSGNWSCPVHFDRSFHSEAEATDAWNTRTTSLAAQEVDSGMSGDAVERAEWFWANLPTGRKWTGLATHEKALVCHQIARITPSLAAQEALAGYRAAVSFISADSWDGCSDCINILKAARCADMTDALTINETAEHLKRIRLHYNPAALPPAPSLAAQDVEPSSLRESWSTCLGMDVSEWAHDNVPDMLDAIEQQAKEIASLRNYITTAPPAPSLAAQEYGKVHTDGSRSGGQPPRHPTQVKGNCPTCGQPHIAAQDGLVEALRLFVGCAYPVAEEINQRGHNWCEAYLDDALPIARAALASLGEQHD